MGHVVHCRTTPDGPRYRLWSTVVDGYLCEPETAEAMRERLLRIAAKEAAAAAARDIAAATEGGSSSRLDDRALDDAWEPERCRCGLFHHDFKLFGVSLANSTPEGGSCASCGEPRTDQAHQPPCAVDRDR